MLPWMLSGFAQPVTVGQSPADTRLAVEQGTQALEARVDSLELACAGLWQLLKQKHGYTDEDIVAAIHEVDAADGSVDGKHRLNQRLMCPHCHRQLLTQRSKNCNWCGKEISRPPF